MFIKQRKAAKNASVAPKAENAAEAAAAAQRINKQKMPCGKSAGQILFKLENSSVKINQTVILHFCELFCHCRSLNREIIGKLLTVKRNSDN